MFDHDYEKPETGSACVKCGAEKDHWKHDRDPSRQQQPVKRASALSTASASASTLSTWDD